MTSNKAKRATGKGTPVVAEKKATTSVHIPDVDISAVVAMEKRVKGELTEHAQFWRIAKPLLSIQSERLSKLLASKGELFTNGGSISDDYASGMKNASKVYKVGLSLSGEIAQESKDLLFFLWRLSFRYSIYQEFQTDIVDLFSLRSKATKEVNESQMSKLNASRLRPLCVAKSILLGECARKQDETLASFAKTILRLGYTVPDGELGKDGRRKASEDDLYNYVETHWSTLRVMKNAGEMVKHWEGTNTRPLAIDQNATEANQEDREVLWAKQVLTGKKSIVALEASKSISAVNKDRIRTAIFDQLRETLPGIAIIRPGTHLYPLTKLGIGTALNDDGEEILVTVSEKATTGQIEDGLLSAQTLVKSLTGALAESKERDANQAVDMIMQGLSIEQKADLVKRLTAS